MNISKLYATLVFACVACGVGCHTTSGDDERVTGEGETGGTEQGSAGVSGSAASFGGATSGSGGATSGGATSVSGGATSSSGGASSVSGGASSGSAGATSSSGTTSGGTDYAIGGTLVGLAEGTAVVLQDNGHDDLALTADGDFRFRTHLSTGADYQVEVLAQPAGALCTVSNGAGAVSNAEIGSVTVTCETTARSIGGTLNGLQNGESVVLQSNLAEQLTLTMNGDFAFGTRVADGSPYAAIIKTQPADQFCTLSGAAGNAYGANVTSMLLSCDAAAPTPTTVTLSPATATAHQGQRLTLTAILDTPASGDAQVGLELNPAGAGTLPATVIVPDGKQSATFDYVNQAASGIVDITATFATSQSVAKITTSGALNHLVISQVYGGGAGYQARFDNDFIELHNPAPNAVSLAGLSVQYKAGTVWFMTALPSVSVPAGGFVLIQEAGSDSTAASLPPPDAVGTMSMDKGQGVIALVANSIPLASGSCGSTEVIDLIGYGGTPDCYEYAPAHKLTNQTSALRGQNGCADTDNNQADFTEALPVPRNSATAPVICQLSP